MLVSGLLCHALIISDGSGQWPEGPIPFNFSPCILPACGVHDDGIEVPQDHGGQRAVATQVIEMGI